MESYIQISLLNDYIFCPKSIYFHKLYGKFNQEIYHETPQKIGKIKHENIDEKKYSSSSRFLQSIEIYSEEYNLCGKIDIFDIETKSLIERKTKISTIYEGYKYQLYAQYFCMQEMGYEVKKLFFHSLVDNKRYELKIPKQKEIDAFRTFLTEFKKFDPMVKDFKQNSQRCKACIYKELCDSANI